MKRRMGALTLALGILWTVIQAGAANVPGDAEAATHGDEAASLQVVTEETQPSFVFRQYTLGVLSHYSYLVGSQGEAVLVDPARNVTRYIKDAEALGLKITRIYVTHSHADFVAGHLEAAKATGAPVLANKLSGVGYPHEAVEDLTAFTFGDVRCVVRTTPGHTPDGTVLLVHHPAAAPQPRLVLTGDTLFIGSVGRPDLMGGTVTAADLAAMCFDSWNTKLAVLPDETQIFPAHGAGSLCGAHLSDAPVSTIGEQKKVNPYVQHKDLNSFIMAVIEGLPEAPQYFKHNAKMNQVGPPLIDWTVTMPPALSPAGVQAQAAAGTWVIDMRDGKAFADGHVPGSISIGLRGRFETWVGTMIPWGEPFVLVGDDAFVEEATYRLHRIGYDHPAGYLEGGLPAWKVAGLPTTNVQLVSPVELQQQIKAGTAPMIIDVRLPTEWMGLRIARNILNIPVNKLATDSGRLNSTMPVLTVCNSAYRSSMGASVLEKAGFKDVRNMEGGGEAWIKAGLPTFGATEHGAAATPGVFVNLPERMSPEDLAQRLMDLPGSLDVVDIRPSAQFAEFSIAGSINVPVAELMGNAAYLTDRRPLVIVCRDGAMSAAVGGALVQKTERSIRFLSGGVTRYYDEVMRPAGIRSRAVTLPAAPAGGGMGAPAAAPTAPAAPAAPATRPQKKSAGC